MGTAAMGCQLRLVELHVCVSVCLSRCKFFSLTETPEDYTIIVDEEGFLGKRFSSVDTLDHGPGSALLPTASPAALPRSQPSTCVLVALSICR